MADIANVLNRKPRRLYLLPSKIRKSPSVDISPPIALHNVKTARVQQNSHIDLNVMKLHYLTYKFIFPGRLCTFFLYTLRTPFCTNIIQVNFFHFC